MATPSTWASRTVRATRCGGASTAKIDASVRCAGHSDRAKDVPISVVANRATTAYSFRGVVASIPFKMPMKITSVKVFVGCTTQKASEEPEGQPDGP